MDKLDVCSGCQSCPNSTCQGRPFCVAACQSCPDKKKMEEKQKLIKYATAGGAIMIIYVVGRTLFRR